ncbi:MAG: M28 family peptidase [Gemmatimonadaceae bacterium]
MPVVPRLRLILRCVALAVTVAPVALSAQARPRAGEVPAAMAAVREADLKRDLFAMASDAMRGREGGTLDEMRASIWVAQQYRQIGLQPLGEDGTYFQWFNIVRTRISTTSSRVTIAGNPMTVFGDIIPLGVVPAELSAPVVWLADASDSSVDVRGKIVATAVRHPAPSSIRPNSYPASVRYVDAAVAGMTSQLARRGAAAILLVADARSDEAFDAFATMRSRGSYDVDNAAPRFAGQPTRIPAPPVPGAGPVPSYLLRASTAALLQRGSTADLQLRLERFEVPSVNIIGVVRGTDPVLRNEYVLFSSHQDANGVRFVIDGDSVWAGADDNGTVSVALFAAARAFVRQPGKRSVLFVHHGSEERGLLGSRYHAAHPMVPLSQVVAVLNGDMIGRNHPDSASLLGAQPPHRNSSELVAMALRANELTGKFTLDSLWDRPTHSEGWYFRSDHVPYARLNVPALMYTTNLHDDYHTPRDTPERIDYGKLTRMAKWMYLTGWFVANAPTRPAIDAGFKLER